MSILSRQWLNSLEQRMMFSVSWVQIKYYSLIYHSTLSNYLSCKTCLNSFDKMSTKELRFKGWKLSARWSLSLSRGRQHTLKLPLQARAKLSLYKRSYLRLGWETVYSKLRLRLIPKKSILTTERY